MSIPAHEFAIPGAQSVNVTDRPRRVDLSDVIGAYA